MADKDDILDEQYGPQAPRYWEMRPEDKQTLTQRLAPNWGRYIPDAARAFLLEAPRALMGVRPAGAPTAQPGINMRDVVMARQKMKMDEGDPLLFGSEPGLRPAATSSNRASDMVIDQNRATPYRNVGNENYQPMGAYDRAVLEQSIQRLRDTPKADGGGIIEEAYGPNTGSTAEFLTQYEHSNPLEPYNAARNVADTHQQGGGWGVAKNIANAWAKGGAGLLGHMVSAPYEAAKSILQDYRPGAENEVVNQDIGRQAFDAGSVIMGGAPMVEKNALGTFGGVTAKTADHAKLARAQEMQAAGAHRNEVWGETGWFQGGDGKWRFEIPDDMAEYHPGRVQYAAKEAGQVGGDVGGRNFNGTLEEVLDHPELYAAYPNMRKVLWSGVPQGSLGSAGGVYRGKVGSSPGMMEISNDIAPRLEAGKSVTLHEGQHHIQPEEGFPRGANPEMFKLTPDQIVHGQRQAAALEDAKYVLAHAADKQMSLRDAIADVEQTHGRQVSDMAKDYAGAHGTNPELSWRQGMIDPGALVPFDQSAATIDGVLAKLNKKFEQAKNPYTAYLEDDGEREARRVQNRMKMTDAERKALHPLDTPDPLLEGQAKFDAYYNKPKPLTTEDILARDYGSGNLLAAGGNRKAAAGVAAKDILEQYGAKPQKLTPAIQVRGEVFAEGPTHAQSLEKYLRETGTDLKNLKDGELVNGFTDPEGNFLTREAAAEWARSMGGKPDLRSLEADWGRQHGFVAAGGNRKAAAGVAAKDILEQNYRAEFDPTRYYHGTASDFPGFDKSKFGSATGAKSAGQAAWLVSDPRTAGGYARYAAEDAPVRKLMEQADTYERLAQKTGKEQWWDKQNDAVVRAEALEKQIRDEGAPGQRIIPAHVRGKYAEHDMGGAEFTDIDKDIQRHLRDAKAAGLEGVKFHNLADDVGVNGRPATHVAVFEPQNMRSPWAAYDPAKRDSTNLLAAGGNRKAAAGVAAKDILEQNYGAPMPPKGRLSDRPIVDPRMDPRLEQAAQLTEPPRMQAAIRFPGPDGKEAVFTGANHGIAYDNARAALGEDYVNRATTAHFKGKKLEDLKWGDNPVDGFVSNGQFYTRNEASAALDAKRPMTAEDVADIDAGLMKPKAKDILEEQYGKGAKPEVRPMSNSDLYGIGDAQYTSPYTIDPVAEVPIKDLKGGHHRPERVGPLAEQIRQNNWIEPLVVDREGNVIEGQHRLRALGQLGVESAPVHRIRELGTPEQIEAIQSAARGAGVHPEQARQVAQYIAEIVDREGVAALSEYAAPRGFEKAWAAGIAALNRRP